MLIAISSPLSPLTIKPNQSVPFPASASLWLPYVMTYFQKE
jgi:hypothetical protein